MQDILRCLRKEPITYISDLKVYSMKDYSIGCNYDYELGTTVDIDVLKSDMLFYTLEDGSFLCIRPSGTEPKLKVYFGVREDNENKAEYKLDKLASGVHLYMDKRFKCDRIF